MKTSQEYKVLSLLSWHILGRKGIGRYFTSLESIPLRIKAISFDIPTSKSCFRENGYFVFFVLTLQSNIWNLQSIE